MCGPGLSLAPETPPSCLAGPIWECFFPTLGLSFPVCTQGNSSPVLCLCKLALVLDGQNLLESQLPCFLGPVIAPHQYLCFLICKMGTLNLWGYEVSVMALSRAWSLSGLLG